MRINLKRGSLKILFISFLLVSLPALSVATDWTAPGLIPPSCPSEDLAACNPPLNVGIATQVKPGSLGLGSSILGADLTLLSSGFYKFFSQNNRPSDRSNPASPILSYGIFGLHDGDGVGVGGYGGVVGVGGINETPNGIAVNATQTNTGYGFYQSGANARNYFEGRVGIGDEPYNETRLNVFGGGTLNAIEGSTGSGVGVYGLSQTGSGVKGSGAGLGSKGVSGVGTSAAVGVEAISDTGYALTAQSNTARAVFAFSSTGGALYGRSPVDKAVEASSDSGYGFYESGNSVGARNYFKDRLGIGVEPDSSVGAGLDIAGRIKIRGGTPGAGKFLTSDADGLASWVTSTGGGMTNPMTTLGDIIYGGSGGVATRLGGVGGFLKSTGAAAPAWSALISTDIPSLDTSKITTGTFSVTRGGTNATTIGVAGSVPYSSGSAYAFTGAGISGQVLTSNGAGVPTWTTPTGGGSQTPWTGNINAAGFTLSGNSTASGNLTLDSTSNATKGNILLNSAGGNVGIGTAAPGSKLTVSIADGATTYQANATQVGLRLVNTNNTNNNWNLINFNSSNNIVAASVGARYINHTANQADLVFGTRNSSGLWGERMRIDSGGNVGVSGNIGVGTFSPSQKLEIAGGLKFNTPGLSKPTCDATIRGTAWFTWNGSGADALEICTKDAANAYAWRALY